MKAIRHMGIVVSDIDKSLKFYVDLLGLKIRKDMLEQGSYIDNMLALKDVQVRTVKMEAEDGNLIELLWYKSHPRARIHTNEICEIGASHVAFTVGNLDEEYKRLSESGVVFNCPPQYSPDGTAKVTFCKDPDGTFIELVEMLA
jgi:catechol 2,3-dioxygenase-like lactoylglutathione lyase family enzyme